MAVTAGRKSNGSKEDKITLWHTASDIVALESFIDEGAQAIGVGRGGQTDGFFVWNKKKYASSHFAYFLGKNIELESLLIGCDIAKKDLTYPEWQFDVEVTKELNPLLFKYKDEISAIKDLRYKDAKGKEQVVSSFIVSPFATENECYFVCERGQSSSCLNIGDNGLKGVDMFQALIDKMCQNQDFRNDYNKLLRKCVTGEERIALKYCGKKPLTVNEVIFIQKKEHGKAVEHTIYKSYSDTKETTAGKSQKQKLCEDMLQLKMDILREKMGDKTGKTADTKTGKIDDEHSDTAQFQTEISKVLIAAKRKMAEKQG